MTEHEKCLSEAINKAIENTLVECEGKTYTLFEAIKEYRGGNYLATKWHKCKFCNYPERDGEYLCLGENGEMRVCFFNGGAFFYDFNTKPFHATHWMNLPLPPKPEG